MARVYTDEDRARVYMELQIHDGNIKRVARETGVPETTVRNWKENWERDGVPDAIQQMSADVAHEFADEASMVRGVALKQLEAKVRKGEGSVKDLAVTIGILTDKIDRARGVAKKNDEPARPSELPSADVLRELARGVVRGALDAVALRDQEIEEAEIVEQAPQALLPSSSN